MRGSKRSFLVALGFAAILGLAAASGEAATRTAASVKRQLPAQTGSVSNRLQFRMLNPQPEPPIWAKGVKTPKPGQWNWLNPQPEPPMYWAK